MKGLLKRDVAPFSPEELAPSTGDPASRPSDDAIAFARSRFRAIYIRTPAQLRVDRGLDRLQALGAATPGEAQRAIRNSAHSCSGKSKHAIEYARRANAAAAPGTTPVLHVELDKASTVRRLWASVCEKAGDEYSDQGSEDVMRRRAFKLMLKLQVRLLIIDEAQHLSYRSTSRNDVTDSIKKALDDGVVPIALVGNEELAPLLSGNIQLSNRMEPPVDLVPLDLRNGEDRAEFKGFVVRLDRRMVEMNLVTVPAGLDDPRMLGCLFAVSNGIIGRVKNLVEQALVHALERGATRIEVYDLMVATDRWAIAQNVIDYNPFRTRPRR